MKILPKLAPARFDHCSSFAGTGTPPAHPANSALRPVFRRRRAALVPILAALLLVGSAPLAHAVSNLGDTVAAWPASFRPYLMANGSGISDVNGDENPASLDLASGPAGTSQSVYYATDDTTAFFRIRMAQDLADSTKGGLVGGAFLVQLYEGTTLRAVVGVDGKSASADTVYVSNAPGSATTAVYTYPWTGTSAAVRTVATGDGTGQFFLDFQVPVARIIQASAGGTAATPLRLFYGSSAAANLATINKDFMIGNSTSYLTYLPNLGEISLVPAALAVSRTVALVSGTGPPTAGAPSTYDVTFTMSSTADGLLDGATMTATIPSGTSYVSSTATAGNGTVSLSGTTLTWSAGTIYGLTSKSIVVRVSTTPPVGSAGTTVTLLSAISATAVDTSVPTNRIATAPDVTVGPVAPPPNSPPVATDFAVNVGEDAASTTIDAAARTTDVDGGTLTYTVTTGVLHGTLTDNGGGSFTYTPAANYNGPDSFTYTACDSSGACDTATVTINVTPVNDAPDVTDSSATTPEDTPVVVDLAASTTDVAAATWPTP